MGFDLSRRALVGASATVGLAAAGPRVLAAATTGPRFTLEPRPTRVFKTKDHSHESTESWIFSLAVQTATDVALTPAVLMVELLKAGAVLRLEAHSAEGFAPLTYHSGFPPKLADGRDPPSPVHWPFVVRLRETVPVTMGVDAMRIRVEAADPAGARGMAEITIPIETYVQKTALLFPFAGKGIVLQAGATNGGHRNRSGMFAIDAMGLDDAAWGVQRGDGKKNTDYPGFGRTLIAPADGVVVHARGDRPDQPVGDESNPDYFADEFKPQGGGDPGNHVVIDHGNGEFSMIAHFQAGSLLVKEGTRVKQGQTLGRLGHSGDTTAPHVHYQLQAGPDWQNADALPVRFVNVDQEFLDRGTYFEAKAG